MLQGTAVIILICMGKSCFVHFGCVFVLRVVQVPLHLTHDNPNHLLLNRVILKHMWLQTSLSFEEGFAASSWLAPEVLLTPALAHSSSLMLLP